MRAIMPMAVVALVLCVTATTTFAVWINNGTPVSTVPGWQHYPVTIPDGNEGAFISWWDQRGGDDDVYVQHISDTGMCEGRQF